MNSGSDFGADGDDLAVWSDGNDDDVDDGTAVVACFLMDVVVAGSEVESYYHYC